MERQILKARIHPGPSIHQNTDTKDSIPVSLLDDWDKWTEN